ncbi:TPA: hypothetical protein ACILHM_001073 [Enterococcus faecium]|nr:hypothetical protein [Enterococcus faecium]HAZ9105227.1 hypothetical protein [Enterococcus faecium]HAZ9116989.1 hypothetical protein [Enterococcus faecium]HAZ9240689.1 hypothetical protein [Enterococcus faecium]HAZ9398993.1 hypothetical protein [Enterococcus faecium]HAZ9615135.1 hypothetical protein [Enterococcus faecium]
MKKVHSFLNYLMGAITIVAVYQAFLKYPDYGTKLFITQVFHQYFG